MRGLFLQKKNGTILGVIPLLRLTTWTRDALGMLPNGSGIPVPRICAKSKADRLFSGVSIAIYWNLAFVNVFPSSVNCADVITVPPLFVIDS